LSATTLILLRAAIAFVAATFGGLIGIVWRKSSHSTLCALVSFAAGALLSVTIVDILPEAASQTGWPRTIWTTLLGLFIFYLIGKYVYYVCPACAASATEGHEKKGYLRLGILMMIALGIHSTIDGLAIAASTAVHGGQLVAYLVLFAVSYHKIPEGLALVTVARLAGMGRLKALAVTAAIELTTGLGAFLGIIALKNPSPVWLGAHLGVVAGSFLYIVGFALITEMMEHERKSILTYGSLGFISILVVGLVLKGFGLGE
jgi:zinc transporter, ZIP family